MDHIYRALLGAAGLIGCVVLLATDARAGPGNPIPIKQAPVRGQKAAVAPTLSGTTAVKISAKRFWDEWERARRDASALPQLRNLIAPAIGMPLRQQIAFVQTAVTKTIGWRSDATQYGRHDYWASAAETLANGRGDMEDRAIVKMQALRALGVPTGDLYLTLGRDTVGGPQTVLIVRDGRNYYILDDTGGPPYAPERRAEFHPVLTFGFGASWVHAVPGARPMIAGGRSGQAMALTGDK